VKQNSTSNPASGTSFFRRLFRAQESGLALVVVLAGVLLAIFGGSKPKLISVPIAADAVVQATERAISVSRNGASTEYPIADGWSLRGEPGSQTLARKTTVNKFLDPDNLVLVAKDASFIAIMAIGMTAIIVMGGIDLSVGSIYALAAIVGAYALKHLQAGALGISATGSVTGEGGAAWFTSIPVGIGVCCMVGAVCGLANGAMIVGLRVHPFVITLGTMAVIRGAVFLVTRGDSIVGFPSSFTSGFFKAPIMGVNPVPVFLMLVVVAIGGVVLSRTVLGRRAYAIGGNETAAVYAGIPVGRVKIILYTLCGMLAGLSAAVYLGYLGAASPDAGQGYELPVIAATVIGGASLSGGRGSAIGALLGAILIQLISNAMIILEIDTSYTQVVMGAAIVAAVFLDQVKSRFMPRGK
jgi:ribose/xylose/arabinose/galactoside ABC-type transport system permease subunit